MLSREWGVLVGYHLCSVSEMMLHLSQMVSETPQILTGRPILKGKMVLT